MTRTGIRIVAVALAAGATLISLTSLSGMGRTDPAPTDFVVLPRVVITAHVTKEMLAGDEVATVVATTAVELPD